eukprot:2432167-Amphidinium_carterae.2
MGFVMPHQPRTSQVKMLGAFGVGVGVQFLVHKGKWQLVQFQSEFGGFREGGTKRIINNCNQALFF